MIKGDLFDFELSPELTDDTPERSALRRIERLPFETRARQYVLEKTHGDTLTFTQATVAPEPAEATGTLFEWGIEGAAFTATGQKTGGFLREVAENEAAFSWALQDPVSLYLVKSIADSREPVFVKQLEEIIAGGEGWKRLALLVKGGLLDVVGSEVRATDRALAELNRILSFCNKART